AAGFPELVDAVGLAAIAPVPAVAYDDRRAHDDVGQTAAGDQQLRLALRACVLRRVFTRPIVQRLGDRTVGEPGAVRRRQVHEPAKGGRRAERRDRARQVEVARLELSYVEVAQRAGAVQDVAHTEVGDVGQQAVDPLGRRQGQGDDPRQIFVPSRSPLGGEL